MLPLAFALTPFFACGQQVFTTDVIVQGSICVGFDCVSGESFGFDTHRLKENNLRLHFDDTSNSGSFPSNDWRIVINDSGNGGSNYFGVEDATAGTMPLRVEAGAPNHALVVEADGDVGIKTNNPVVDLHIVEGNTPTVRLEQDGSDGFTPQTWDLAGNETNFFIRDVNTGRLPFRIRPGAPNDALYVTANGNVSIGDDTAQEKLDVDGNILGKNMRGETITAIGNFVTTNDLIFKSVDESLDLYKFGVDDGLFTLQDLQTETNVIVVNEGAPQNTLFIHDSGSVSIGSDTENNKLYIDGGLTVNGDIHALSDQRIKKDITDIKYGLSDVMKLSAKQYNFDTGGKYNLNLSPNAQIGLIAQEVQKVIPEVVTDNINIKEIDGKESKLKGVNYSALIPVLIHAIQEQQQLIIDKDSELEAIKAQLNDLSLKVSALVNQTGQDNTNPISPPVDLDSQQNSTGIKSTNNSTAKKPEVLNNGRSNEGKQ